MFATIEHRYPAFVKPEPPSTFRYPRWQQDPVPWLEANKPIILLITSISIRKSKERAIEKNRCFLYGSSETVELVEIPSSMGWEGNVGSRRGIFPKATNIQFHCVCLDFQISLSLSVISTFLAVLKGGKDWSEEMGCKIHGLSAQHVIQRFLSFSWWPEDKLGDAGNRHVFTWWRYMVHMLSPMCTCIAVRGGGGPKKPCGESELWFCLPALGFTQ